MSTNQIVSKVWSFCNTLRDGVGYCKMFFTKLLLLVFFICFVTITYAQTHDSSSVLYVPELHWTLHYPATFDSIRVRDMQSRMNETKEQYFKNDTLVNLNSIRTLLTLKTNTGGMMHSNLKLMKNTNQPSEADFERMKKALIEFYKSSGKPTVEITKQKIDNKMFDLVRLSVVLKDGSPNFYEENYSLLDGKYLLSIVMYYTNPADAKLFHDMLFTSSFH